MVSISGRALYFDMVRRKGNVARNAQIVGFKGMLINLGLATREDKQKACTIRVMRCVDQEDERKPIMRRHQRSPTDSKRTVPQMTPRKRNCQLELDLSRFDCSIRKLQEMVSKLQTSLFKKSRTYLTLMVMLPYLDSVCMPSLLV